MQLRFVGQGPKAEPEHKTAPRQSVMNDFLPYSVTRLYSSGLPSLRTHFDIDQITPNLNDLVRYSSVGCYVWHLINHLEDESLH